MNRKPTSEESLLREKQVAERFSRLPTTISAPSRENTALCMPTGDCRIDTLTVRGMMECIPYYAAFIEQPGCSHVSLARNKIIHQFTQSPFEWCVMVDSDIGFTASDWKHLMQFMVIEDTDPFTATAGNWTARPHDFAANAVYSRKDDSGEVIYNGLGFARVHRSVFQVLAETLCMASSFQGVDMVDYFPSGSFPNGQWMGEDGAFWLLCHEIGVIPRRETRTNLLHAGRSVYAVNPLMIPSAPTHTVKDA